MKPNLFIVLAVLLPVFRFFCESVAASPADSLDALRNERDWVGLGYAYLERGHFEDARKAFRQGARGDSAAAAYNGMGLAYGRDPKAVKRKAFEYFRRALGVDEGYLEARMNIARLHIQLGDLNAEHALKDVIEAHPTYAPAYLMLADWFRDSIFPEKRIALYNRYLEIMPGDIRGYQGLAMTYIELHNYPEALKALEPAVTDTSSDSRLLPLAAQAWAALGDPERAVELFQEYFHALPDSERALYEDLSLGDLSRRNSRTTTARSGKGKAKNGCRVLLEEDEIWRWSRRGRRGRRSTTGGCGMPGRFSARKCSRGTGAARCTSGMESPSIVCVRTGSTRIRRAWRFNGYATCTGSGSMAFTTPDRIWRGRKGWTLKDESVKDGGMGIHQSRRRPATDFQG